MIDDGAVYGFLDEYKLRCGINERYIDLSSEVGELGIDPASALDSALAKYKRRFDAKGRIGSGDN